MITLDGRPADVNALQPGRYVRFLTIEGTNQAYEVRVATGSARTPLPDLVMARIVSPNNGETVGRVFMVQGTAQPGALVIVQVAPRLFGNSMQVQTTATSDGTWAVNVNAASLPLVSFPYVVSATEVYNGIQTDASSVQVTVQQ